MTRGMLIIGNESPLFSAVEEETIKRVEQYAAAVIPGPNAAADTQKKGRETLSWNPSSPLSSRTLILGAENRLGRIDEALLVCSPPAFYRSPETLSPADADKYINDQVKSWIFVARDLALIFKAQGDGSVCFIFPDDSYPNEKSIAGSDANANLLGSSASASFRALAQGYIASSGSSPYRIMGFTGCNPGSEKEFAAWLFKLMDDGGKKNNNRLHKYSKLPFFK